MSPWLLTWLANYKRASHSGALCVFVEISSLSIQHGRLWIWSLSSTAGDKLRIHKRPCNILHLLQPLNVRLAVKSDGVVNSWNLAMCGCRCARYKKLDTNCWKSPLYRKGFSLTQQFFQLQLLRHASLSPSLFRATVLTLSNLSLESTNKKIMLVLVFTSKATAMITATEYYSGIFTALIVTV